MDDGSVPGRTAARIYSFNRDHVLVQHLLHSIDHCLYLSDPYAYLANFYSPIGRPSIDPESMA